MISGLGLKYLKGERFVIQQGYETNLAASRPFISDKTHPADDLGLRIAARAGFAKMH
ncbi:hypothetical protein SAMN05444414_11310 [Roseovarius marisflavi]|uniref:Uncharacterized protein n=1 Tax=Roseovarius marisflavi TaxID=1054996 RepID=A0A1M7ACC2_9RHOB|nr:hypothetical protein [Roseovarius marisflavi]SHL40373.1 hypothetical protein SAMN05444414_11310 [Roseovarius marisflavi]